MKNSLIRRIAFVISCLLLPVISNPVLAEEQQSSQPPAIGVEKININKADVETLSMIKGIGTVKAQAIIDYRTNMGKFHSLDELVKVKGIGQATLKKISPYLTL